MMNDTFMAKCRFCAKARPYDKLLNLQMDEERKRKVIVKLHRLSLEVVNFNSPHDTVAKTVCFLCMESLDRAFEFVVNVEACQKEFEACSVVKLKQEALENNVGDLHENNIIEPTIKIEVEITDEVLTSDSEISSDNLNTQESNIKKEKETENVKMPVRHSSIDPQASTLAEHDIKNESEERKVQSIVTNKGSINPDLSWKDYSWLCAYCDVMFTTIDELQQHSRQSHSCCNPYRCIDCRIRKLNLDHFIRHVKQHRNNLKTSCYKCFEIFDRQCDAKFHKRDHVLTAFKCPGCNTTFSNNKFLLNHCKMYNKDRKIREVPPEHLTKDLCCVFCQKQFGKKGNLTTHLLTQHREQKRNHTCDKCGKGFLNKGNLSRHMLMHDDIRPYECDICKHCFREKIQLTRHMGIHDSKKPFTCAQCGRCFRLKRHLNMHSIVHTDEYPYVCSYCKKGFKHKSTFTQHERQHTGEKPYQCHECGREFTNWSNYNKHMKRRHNMNMAKSQQSQDHSNQTMTDYDLTNGLTMGCGNFVSKLRGGPIPRTYVKKKNLCYEIERKLV